MDGTLPYITHDDYFPTYHHVSYHTHSILSVYGCRYLRLLEEHPRDDVVCVGTLCMVLQQHGEKRDQ